MRIFFLFVSWNGHFIERIFVLTMVTCGAWQKLAPFLCRLMLFCSACLAFRTQKIKCWMLSFYQLCTVKQYPSLSKVLDPDFWRIVLNNGCLACTVLFHNYIYHGCVQTLTQVVGTSYSDIISFHGLLYPVIYLCVSDHTDWVQWACTSWLQTVPPGKQWYVLPASVVVICRTNDIWKE
jgi:hypothetical protein